MKAWWKRGRKDNLKKTGERERETKLRENSADRGKRRS